MQTITLDLTQPEQTIVIDEDSELLGLFIGTEEQVVKTKIAFVHRSPNITSRIHIKAVLKDKAQFDCEAMLVIENGAKNTDSYLKIDCLLASEYARARAVPGLEITQDEVKGGHGATVGRIDPKQLYYLASRGLNAETAKELIVEAFIQEIQQKIAAVK
jgi:Fe-S cluster assembly protein SufD